jgi:peptide-methionine (R)-S-oxide reductase
MSERQRLIRPGVVASGLFLSVAASAAMAEDPLANAPLAPQSAAKVDGGDKSPSDMADKTDASARGRARPEFVVKTAAEWRRILSKVQYAVTREKATEPPFTGKYSSGHFKGTFICVCCDAAQVQSELFSSQTKFESGTGWPSFYQAVSPKAVQTAWDYGGPEPRLEVMCRRCGAHLGHVFDDGPPPTGLRFCLNSAALKLNSPEAEASSKHAVSKTASKAKTKAKPKVGAKSAPAPNPPDDSTTPESSDRAAPGDEKKEASPSTSS